MTDISTMMDTIIRSRHTLLNILDERGYDVTAYRNIAPDQIVTMSEKMRSLDITVSKKPDGPAPCDRAVVVYLIQEKVDARVRNGTLQRDLPKEDGITPKDDILVLINEPLKDTFSKASLQLWQTDKVRMTFFHIKQVVLHLGHHRDVPRHRKLDDDEKKVVMERFHISARSQLPQIKFSDIQARLLGLVPGDIVEIERPSSTAGIANYWRMCAA